MSHQSSHHSFGNAANGMGDHAGSNSGENMGNGPNNGHFDNEYLSDEGGDPGSESDSEASGSDESDISDEDEIVPEQPNPDPHEDSEDEIQPALPNPPQPESSEDEIHPDLPNLPQEEDSEDEIQPALPNPAPQEESEDEIRPAQANSSNNAFVSCESRCLSDRVTAAVRNRNATNATQASQHAAFMDSRNCPAENCDLEFLHGRGLANILQGGVARSYAANARARSRRANNGANTSTANAGSSSLHSQQAQTRQPAAGPSNAIQSNAGPSTAPRIDPYPSNNYTGPIAKRRMRPNFLDPATLTVHRGRIFRVTTEVTANSGAQGGTPQNAGQPAGHQQINPPPSQNVVVTGRRRRARPNLPVNQTPARNHQSTTQPHGARNNLRVNPSISRNANRHYPLRSNNRQNARSSNARGTSARSEANRAGQGQTQSNRAGTSGDQAQSSRTGSSIPHVPSGRSCAICGVTATCSWRRHIDGSIICNACKSYWYRHGQLRPQRLWRHLH